jgi:hypothetical protein
MRACAIATLAVLVAGLAAAQDKDKKDAKDKDKPAIREIAITEEMKITVVPPEKGKVTEPYIYSAVAGLRDFTLFKPPAIEALTKQINFDKEKLVVFWWGGSGQDKIAAGELIPGDPKPEGKGPLGAPPQPGAKAPKKPVATFTYTPGKTLDLRGHLKLFVVPADAEVKVETGK